MLTSMKFVKTIKIEKPINRAQRILRKNRENFPGWYWRLLQDRSFEIMTLSYYVPKAEMTMEPDGRVSFRALSADGLPKEV